MARIFVDYTKKTIYASKSFLKKARSTDSTEYQELLDVTEKYGGFSIKERKIKTCDKKEVYKGLTYKYMEKYIRLHDNAENMMAEYIQQRLVSESHKSTYGEVKEWFLEKYPEVAVFGMQDIDEESNSETQNTDTELCVNVAA